MVSESGLPRNVWLLAIAPTLLAVLAAVLGHPAIAGVSAGGLIVYVAVLLGRQLTLRASAATDAKTVLLWQILLMIVVLLALVGVGVIGAAIR